MHRVDAGQGSAAGRDGRAWWVSIVVLVAAVPALGQFSRSDIEALRERGKTEGWTFTVGENEATQYPLEQLCGTVKPPGWDDELYRAPHPTPTGERALPVRFDWRQLGGVTPVRNQGGCGSCWAFAACGAAEAKILIEAGWSTDLSEQWLVSCTNAGSCSGGWHHSALSYMSDVSGYNDSCGDDGAVREVDFPYVASDVACDCPYPHPYVLDNRYYTGDTVEEIKQAIYDHGPVATTVYVNDAFGAYTGGVFNACEDHWINHAVVLVGWDDTQGTNGVWIMRNSWGTGWGENGYMRIEYGCSRIGDSSYYCAFTPGADCNGNGLPDGPEVAEGLAPDCNGNGVPDDCDLAAGTSGDCNWNGIPDECDIVGGMPDANGNGVPDACEIDCNGNGMDDYLDLLDGTSADCNGNLIPDECDIAAGTSPDCNANGVPDACDLAAGTSPDCNTNQVPDECDIASGTSPDCNGNGVPDLCDLGAGTSPDCNDNQVPDECDVAGATSGDCNTNGVPDECDLQPGLPAITADIPARLGWTEIAGTGQYTGLGDEDAVVVTMPFAVPLLPTVDATIHNNGGVGFGGELYLGRTNDYLPSVAAFGGAPALLPFWDDLDDGTGAVIWDVIGTAPQRTFIVEWRNLPHYMGDTVIDGDEVTFQVQIFEDAGDGVCAQFLYQDTFFDNWRYDNGRSATIGYQGGDDSVMWSCNQINAVDPTMVLSVVTAPPVLHDADGDGVPDECDQWALGDLNCDGIVDVFDINPFVQAVLDPAGYAADHPECDITLGDLDGGGTSPPDVFDINPFVELLLSE